MAFYLGETDFNECESTPCQNNGECIDLIGRYQCRCAGTGFEGVNCAYQISFAAKIDSILINSNTCYYFNKLLFQVKLISMNVK